MHFRVKTPCKQCPLTKTCLKGWLGASRMRDIMRSLTNDHNLFPCHETTHGEEGDEGKYQYNSGESACAGALIYQEAHGLRAVLTRIAMAMKDFDPALLRGKGRVFKNAAAAIQHHTEE